MKSGNCKQSFKLILKIQTKRKRQKNCKIPKDKKQQKKSKKTKETFQTTSNANEKYSFYIAKRIQENSKKN